MTPGTRLGTLAALEVEGLHSLNQFDVPAESGGCELIEIARIGGLFFRQHAALAGTDTGTRKFRTGRERHLRFLRQRAEAHVRNEQRNAQL